MRLAILGGGPAGYAAAATAAHLGADVTLVEDNQLGGNCTMTDAIPSKTLLTTADAMLEISRAESDGVDFVHGFPEPSTCAARWPGRGRWRCTRAAACASGWTA